MEVLSLALQHGSRQVTQDGGWISVQARDLAVHGDVHRTSTLSTTALGIPGEGGQRSKARDETGKEGGAGGILARALV